MKWDNIEIKIDHNEAESKEHLPDDYTAVQAAGLNNLMKGHFMDWLLGARFADSNRDQVAAGLKLYEVNYHYGKIVAQYSPTSQEGDFGQFEFCFESGSDFTRDILQAVAMQVYVADGKVVKVSGYDI